MSYLFMGTHNITVSRCVIAYRMLKHGCGAVQEIREGKLYE
jgi:hypothetical protein